MKRIINGVIDLTGKKQINKGCSGVVYNLGNGKCFKLIYNPEYTNIYDKGEIIKTISNYRLHNYCLIEDMQFDDEGYVLGYQMPIYQEKDAIDPDILVLPKEYLIDSYRNIHTGVLKLSSNNIIMVDFGSHNVFITENGIIVYDFDLYVRGTSPEGALVRNMAKLNITFNEILKKQVLDNHSIEDPRLTDKNTDLLFNYRTTPETLAKQLVRYKRPIDFLRGHHEKTI
ncbi:MAG: hypothetical protein J6X02_06040 [Bacilli bacterium]|nr:hypothetical protein [Bacilli bacterium]